MYRDADEERKRLERKKEREEAKKQRERERDRRQDRIRVAEERNGLEKGERETEEEKMVRNRCEIERNTAARTYVSARLWVLCARMCVGDLMRT